MAHPFYAKHGAPRQRVPALEGVKVIVALSAAMDKADQERKSLLTIST